MPSIEIAKQHFATNANYLWMMLEEFKINALKLLFVSALLKRDDQRKWSTIGKSNMRKSSNGPWNIIDYYSFNSSLSKFVCVTADASNSAWPSPFIKSEILRYSSIFKWMNDFWYLCGDYFHVSKTKIKIDKKLSDCNLMFAFLSHWTRPFQMIPTNNHKQIRAAWGALPNGTIQLFRWMQRDNYQRKIHRSDDFT